MNIGYECNNGDYLLTYEILVFYNDRFLYFLFLISILVQRAYVYILPSRVKDSKP